jgi:hypothetical protein
MCGFLSMAHSSSSISRPLPHIKMNALCELLCQVYLGRHPITSVDPTGLLTNVRVYVCVCAQTASSGVACSWCMHPYRAPCGRRGKSWCALDLLAMRQRGKKRSVMPSRYSFCSFFRLHANVVVVVQVQGSQHQLGGVAGKMGTRCVIRTSVQSRSRNHIMYIQRSNEDKLRQNTTGKSEASKQKNCPWCHTASSRVKKKAMVLTSSPEFRLAQDWESVLLLCHSSTTQGTSP